MTPEEKVIRDRFYLERNIIRRKYDEPIAELRQAHLKELIELERRYWRDYPALMEEMSWSRPGSIPGDSGNPQ